MLFNESRLVSVEIIAQMHRWYFAVALHATASLWILILEVF
jgi:hypothetical protein